MQTIPLIRIYPVSFAAASFLTCDVLSKMKLKKDRYSGIIGKIGLALAGRLV